MTIFDLIADPGIYKKMGGKDGGEYHGPCPKCSTEPGSLRFHVWPLQGLNGTYWCRRCGIKGDAIQYLRDVEGLGYHAACKRLGEAPKNDDIYSTPKTAKQHAGAIQPRECTEPQQLWQEHAEKIATQAHETLLCNREQMEWLAGRGISEETVITYKLGWLAKDEYRARSSWGLAEEIKPDGKAKKLWLPMGLIIPYYQTGPIQRIRIRKPEGQPRYYVIPGSSTAPMILTHGSSSVVVVVESELDALAIISAAGDAVTALSLGNSTARPDADADTLLRNAALVLVALDNDESGKREALKWPGWYRAAVRWPVPAGKDPGEAVKAGVDLRTWLLSALPVSLQPQPLLPPAPVFIPVAQPAFIQNMTDKKGRGFVITDSRTVCREKEQQGHTVFGKAEMQKCIAGIDEAGESGGGLASLMMECKHVFKGSHFL